MSDSKEQIDRILALFSNDEKLEIISFENKDENFEEIISFRELSYKCKKYEKFKYCNNKPTKMWKYKKKKFKICKSCCKKYRDIFYI